MNPAWTRGSLFAVNRELPVTEASMPDRLTCSRINEEIHKLTLLRNGECQNDRAYLAMFLLLVVVTASAWAQTAATSGEVENVFPQARALYVDVHQNPELSGHETQTAEKLVSRLRTLGYEVTEHVGGNGIVALLKNGPGPTVMLRTELDALPVEEKTGLPYASKIHTKDDAGHEVPVMHACGHDLHMASLIGTATIMANTKNTWHGTLMLIGQPAEETITGAKKMIDDGLFTRFRKPDVAVALHTSNELPGGKLGSPPAIDTRTPIPFGSRSTAKVAMVPRLIQLSIPSLSPPELFLPCRPSPRARSSRERRLWSLSDTFKLARRTTSFPTRPNSG